jgi:flagellar secretion chaperone FliS
MYSSKSNNNKNSKLNPYFVKEILEANQQQLLIKVYDFAIINCQKHDLFRTNSALQQLISALRFDRDDVKEVSVGLMKLYQFCQNEMRNKNYDIVLEILTELRNSWLEAFRNLG